MSGYLYRGRHCGAEKRARPKSIGPMMDFSCDETDKGPPVQMHSLREFEQHLNDLKKENFSLKLRIYFLEEKIQQKFEESSDGVHKRNIELKVEVESLKKELEEKQEHLDKALSTAESLSNQNEAELQRRLAERQEEIIHMQEILETKVQLLQEIASTNLRPDLTLWSSLLRLVYITELTVPWEDTVEEAYERKSLMYAELEADAEQHSWKAKVCPVDVGCRGFVGKSTTKLLKEMGMPSPTSALSGVAEQNPPDGTITPNRSLKYVHQVAYCITEHLMKDLEDQLVTIFDQSA
ncbi:uncharacterized protein LOC126396967 [Epinephelus moara]|uniref:uncharacterized protein LOC126396967 n=1 Tax=Epinephelus moara TaxID=300413 RepID=UPI00214E75A8|nr:uncharacterized protein LOC126396967 [Epinephelus moara]